MENKKQFFALYLGQEILIYAPDPLYKRKVNGHHLENAHDFTIELTPLSLISDEDAIEFYDSLFPENRYSKQEKIFSGIYYLTNPNEDIFFT